MKRTVLIFSMLLFTLFSFGQIKVIESSAKRAPKWVNGLEKDFIIVTGSSSSIQDAQQNALNMVKERIVSSVAEHVKTSSEMKVEESTLNNISIYLENFASTTTTASGPVPFLQGISLSKVEEYYWEKVENRATRAVTYNYHIKYPFPYIEMWKLVDEFKQRDKELTNQLDELLAGVDKVKNTEDIDRSIGELRVLADYFVDARKDKANLGITQYRALFDRIEIVEMDSELGLIKFALRIGDQFIQSTRKPQVRSECARITDIRSDNNFTTIRYDFENCSKDPENHIMVSYRFGNKNVQKPFYFDVTANSALIIVSDPVHLKAISVSDDMVEGAVVDFVVNSEYDAPFTVQKIVLEFPKQSPIVIDGIGASFQGKGNHPLKITVTEPFKASTTSAKGRNIAFISGYIHYKSDNTGEVKTYRIYNHKYSTDW